MQTSLINVIILTKEAKKQVIIDQSKIKTTHYKASGPGGQKRNKVLSGVRLQYEGFLIECCDTRNQHKNREIALARLLKKINQQSDQKRQDNIRRQEKSQNINQGSRGGYQRNYNYKRNRIECGGEKFSLSRFMSGDLSQIYKNEK